MPHSQLTQIPLYPLRFEPVFQYRLWGGRRLSGLLAAPMPGDDPIGEAWLLSDRDDHPTLIAEGPLKGRTLGELLEQWPEQLLGKLSTRFSRFPLLLKFLDAHERLSVQVHPSDRQPDYLPAGEHGKTEAWIVLEAGPDSRIFAGLKPGTTASSLQWALENGAVADRLAWFTPKLGEGVFLPAGTVHALGNDLVVFEVQQNSDVTFRLFDWDRVDPKTGRPRPLQIDEAMACIDFAQGVIGPVVPLVEESKPVFREQLFHCEHFVLWRLRGESTFPVGATGMPRVLVGLDGEGQLECDGANYAIGKGDVMLLPAVIGACAFQPRSAVSLLEIALPEEA